MSHRRLLLTVPCVAAAIGLTTAFGGISGASVAPKVTGVTSTQVTLGLVGDLSGLESSSFADGLTGAQARIRMQNANGGVAGRKLVLDYADDQSNPFGGAKTAAEDLVQNDHVFGIISDSSVFSGAEPYLKTNKVPVTGNGLDGPEWGSASNMFTYALPTFAQYGSKKTSHAYTTLSLMLKSLGVKKVAVLGYGIAPSAILSVHQTVAADTKVGLSNCYENTSFGFGATNFSAAALAIQNAGCDGVIGTFVESSNIALSNALATDPHHPKEFYYTSYSPDSLSNSVGAVLKNSYSQGALTTSPGAAGAAQRALQADLLKYDPSYHGGVPSFGTLIGWYGTDTMIEGLTLAGKNLTVASFESKLRTVKTYKVGGAAVDFNYLKGVFPKTECISFVKIVGPPYKFTLQPTSGAPICGSLLTFTGS